MMNAEQAKAATYAVRPPQQPPPELLEDIKTTAEAGGRSVAVTCDVSEEQMWWLKDAGYTMVTAAKYDPCRSERLIRISW